MTTRCSVVAEELAHDLGVVVDHCRTRGCAIHAHSSVVEAYARRACVIAIVYIAHRRVKLITPCIALCLCDRGSTVHHTPRALRVWRHRRRKRRWTRRRCWRRRRWRCDAFARVSCIGSACNREPCLELQVQCCAFIPHESQCKRSGVPWLIHVAFQCQAICIDPTFLITTSVACVFFYANPHVSVCDAIGRKLRNDCIVLFAVARL